MQEILNKIFCADNIQFCREKIPSNSIDMIMTSPPYDSLRTYKGFEWNFEGLTHELYRILKVGGVVVWVVNDAVVNGRKTLTSMRQAIYFVDYAGFNMWDVMGYCKEAPQPIPASMKRYSSAYEYTFVLTKDISPKTFNPIMEKTKWAGLVSSTGFRQPNGDVRNTRMQKINDEKIKSNLWFYGVGFNQTTTDKFAFDHPAMYPEELVKDHVISWTNPGDIIYDPFMGSGTTAKISMMLGRNFIGTDISEEYCKIARKRVEIYDIPLFNNVDNNNDIVKNLEMFDDEE